MGHRGGAVERWLSFPEIVKVVKWRLSRVRGVSSIPAELDVDYGRMIAAEIDAVARTGTVAANGKALAFVTTASTV